MKKILILITSVLLIIALSSCFPKLDPDNDVVYLKETEEGMEVLLKENVDAFELVLNRKIDEENIIAKQNVLSIVRVYDNSTLIAVSNLKSVDLEKPVIVVNDNSFSISECESVVLNSGYNVQATDDPKLIGDYSGDGMVALLDFSEFAPAYGSSTGTAKYKTRFDIGDSTEGYGGVWSNIFSVEGTPDGEIGIQDFAVFGNNYGYANPHLGVWTFTGNIDYDSATYGPVDAVGSGTLTVGQTNWQMSGPVELTANATYTEEGEVKHSEVTIELDSVDVFFTAEELLVQGTVVSPVDPQKTYTVELRGKLEVDGNKIYNEVDGTGTGYGIFLMNPERKLGELEAAK
jgi:hypothetical protein